MRAALLRAPGQLVVEQTVVPTADEEHVVIRVRAVGICGSDLHAYHGTQPFFQYPQVPGHEICGTLHEADGRVGRLQPGDRVVIDPTIACGRCYPCRIGRYNCCPHLQVIGVHVPGGMAEFVRVPEQNLHVLPAGIPFEIGALVEPLAIGVQANERGRIAEGESVGIIGAGMIGLSVLLVAKLRGARVLIADRRPVRLRKARELGADATVDVTKAVLADEVLAFTNGEGANVVVEAVGTVETIRSTFDLVSAAGRVVVLGLCNDDVPIPGAMLISKEMEIIASRLNANRFPQVIAMLVEGEIDPSPLITHRASMDSLEQAFRSLSDPASSDIKAVLEL